MKFDRFTSRAAQCAVFSVFVVQLAAPSAVLARELPASRPAGTSEGLSVLREYEADGGSGLGSSLSRDGNRFAAGAPGDELGSVLIYSRPDENSAWTQEAKLTSPEDGFRVRFGAAVALDGDTLAVGAPSNFNDDIDTRGTVFIYERRNGQWENTDRLTRFSRGCMAAGRPDPSTGHRRWIWFWV
ncbi:MAG: FG-GAP repeat protein [Myxococcota bacterium]